MPTLDFPNMDALAAHALRLGPRLNGALALGVRNAARKIHSKAKAMFGHYQTGDGPFGSWPELQDTTKEERVRQGYSANEPLKRSGDLMRSYVIEQHGLTAGVGSPEAKALGQEIGVPGHNVPARSTLGIAFVKSEREGFGVLNELIGATLVYGGTRSPQALISRGMLGEEDTLEEGGLAAGLSSEGVM